MGREARAALCVARSEGKEIDKYRNFADYILFHSISVVTQGNKICINVTGKGIIIGLSSHVKLSNNISARLSKTSETQTKQEKHSLTNEYHHTRTTPIRCSIAIDVMLPCTYRIPILSYLSTVSQFYRTPLPYLLHARLGRDGDRLHAARPDVVDAAGEALLLQSDHRLNTVSQNYRLITVFLIIHEAKYSKTSGNRSCLTPPALVHSLKLHCHMCRTLTLTIT